MSTAKMISNGQISTDMFKTKDGPNSSTGFLFILTVACYGFSLETVQYRKSRMFHIWGKYLHSQ